MGHAIPTLSTAYMPDPAIKTLSQPELTQLVWEYERIITFGRASYEDYEHYVACQLELLLRKQR